MSILEVSGLRKDFSGLVALANLSLSIPEGGITAVIGPNGAGKTTLFNVVSGFVPATAGKVLYRGRPILGLKPHQIVSLGIVRTFQNVRLFKDMTVLENVMAACRVDPQPKLFSAALRLPGSREKERLIRERALKWLSWVGLEKEQGRGASELPFGQQRLLEIARAVAAEPRLMLLDEPAAGLNRLELQALSRILLRIRRREITLVVVEHNIDFVMGIAERVVVLDKGAKIAEGAPGSIRQHPGVLAAYLGEEI